MARRSRSRSPDQPNVKTYTFGAGIEKLDLELPVGNGRALSDQLIHAGSTTVPVPSASISTPRDSRGARPSIVTLKRIGAPGFLRPDEMNISRVEAMHDLPVGLVWRQQTPFAGSSCRSGPIG